MSFFIMLIILAFLTNSMDFQSIPLQYQYLVIGLVICGGLAGLAGGGGSSK